MEKFDDKLDKYLFNRPAEKDFKKIIDADEALASEYKFRKKIIEEFEEAEVLNVRERLNAIHNKIEQPKKSVKKKYYVLLILLLASIIIGAIFISKISKPAEDNSVLYATHFTPLALESNERNAAAASDVKDFATAYSNQSYAEAIRSIDKLLLEDDLPKWRMYKVVCLMQLNNLESAATELNQIIASGDIIYRDQAIWYQALIALKQNEIEQAKSKLSILSADPEADYHNEAIQLLKEL